MRKHLWIFSGAIDFTEGEPDQGDVVHVFDSQENFIATGHCQNGSIAIRIISFDQIVPDKDFWKSKFQNAFDYRSALGLTDGSRTNAY